MTLAVWIPGDQLLADHPALRGWAPGERSVVLVESEQLKRRRPYHRHKLVLVISAMRHYATELTARGHRVDYVRAATVAAGLRQHLAANHSTGLVTMAAANFAGRQWQTTRATASLGVPVTVLPNTQFLTGRHNPFPAPKKRLILETYYRAMRRHFGLLMEGGQPVGGRWNFDADNRRPLPAETPLPQPVSVTPDALTQAVMQEVEAAGHGLGTTAGFAYAVTRAEAQAALQAFVAERLDLFGPYEDAMTARHATLFHSALSPYLNLGLLDPLETAQAAVAAYAAGRARLSSVEGFVRQVVGWREYLYWQYWRLMPGLAGRNAWAARRPLPAFFWTGATDLRCLRHVLQRALATGYTHHIERLMVVSNFALLTGLDPQAVTEWFQAVYVDAYDWVMQPNVIGMALNADGGEIATKPYVASARYLNQMGDYCRGCRFNPKARTGPEACPFNFLYWNFLLTHEAALRANPRLGPAVLGVRHLTAEDRRAVTEAATTFLAALSGPG